MTPFPTPMPTSYSRRRNRHQMVEHMKQMAEQSEQAALERQFKIEDFKRMIDQSEMPEEVKAMIEMQLAALAPPEQQHEPPTLEQLKCNELEQLADLYAGSYVSREPNGVVVMWDFNYLLAHSGYVEYRGGSVYLHVYGKDESPLVLFGKTAEAFIRYLYYLGLFELESNKKPCPDCGSKPPQDCDTCGGLGWVL